MSSQGDDRRINEQRIRSKNTDDFSARHSRHSDVEQNENGPMPSCLSDGFFPVSSDDDLEAAIDEVFLVHREAVLEIVDEQYRAWAIDYVFVGGRRGQSPAPDWCFRVSAVLALITAPVPGAHGGWHFGPTLFRPARRVCLRYVDRARHLAAHRPIEGIRAAGGLFCERLSWTPDRFHAAPFKTTTAHRRIADPGL